MKRVREALLRLEEATAAWDGPVMERQPRDPFRILIGCLLSLRTKDAVTDAACERLFALADTPQAMRALPLERVQHAIYPVAFYRVKARQIHAICDRLQSGVPATLDGLLALPGVGLKTANLVLSVGFDADAICVDTHVHRIANRLGWIQTTTPEQSEAALRKVLPRSAWKRVNAWLVVWGQRICTPTSPRCSQCALADFCPRRGVARSR
ncbi:MAG: endonuclease III domain-containing protein [Candidatus Xenobia bacterium]